MKTAESTHNDSVTLTVSIAEAMDLWRALEHHKRTYKGHPDCAPRIQNMLRLIKSSIQSETPHLFETCFGYMDDPSERKTS